MQHNDIFRILLCSIILQNLFFNIYCQTRRTTDVFNPSFLPDLGYDILATPTCADGSSPGALDAKYLSANGLTQSDLLCPQYFGQTNVCRSTCANLTTNFNYYGPCGAPVTSPTSKTCNALIKKSACDSAYVYL